MSIQKRLKAARSWRQKTQREVSDAVGMSQASYSELENKEGAKSIYITKIAHVLDVNPEWLALGIGDPPWLAGSVLGINQNKIKPDRLTVVRSDEPTLIEGTVPLISWIAAGAWNDAEDPYSKGDAEDWLPCPVRYGNHSYALRVTGDSMTSPVGRSYPEGAIIFVDPDRLDCAPGDRVVARLTETGAVTFKQLANDGTTPYLRALNPQHGPIFADFTVIGKVIGMFIPD